GARWTKLIEATIAFEMSTIWQEEKLPLSTERPVEIGMWMKEHRKAGDYNKILPNFGERMLRWWRDIGPDFRKGPRPDDWPEEQEWPVQSKEGRDRKDFCCLLKSGNNGFLLIVQALTWW
ncbi:hypothetical protein GGX14DRAFT_340847, partial [Mycena pura]